MQRFHSALYPDGTGLEVVAWGLEEPISGFSSTRIYSCGPLIMGRTCAGAAISSTTLITC